jgi:hypothetical protein
LFSHGILVEMGSNADGMIVCLQKHIDALTNYQGFSRNLT